MIECPVNHPALPALFDPTIPDHPALWAVLEGRHTGRAMVDDVEHPMQCVLRTDAALTYSSRQIGQAFLQAAIAHLQRVGPIWLVWRPALSTPGLAPQADETVERLEFYDYDPRSAVLTELRQRLPAGFRLCSIDRQLIERCEWRSDMEFYCAYLIQACEQRGYHAYWSCDMDNLASIRVARKLGFRQEQAYQVLEYRHLI